MSVKEKYIKLKNKILEFKKDAINLEDHEVSDSNIYRLHFVDYDKNSKGYVSTQYISKPFKFKYPMSRKEQLDVVSYLFNFVHLLTGVNINTFTATRLVCGVMVDYPQFGIVNASNAKEEDIIDLYVLNGNIKVFKNSHYYDNYFNWYNPSMEYSDVDKLYKRYDVELDRNYRPLVLNR